MKGIRNILLVVLALFILYVKLTTSSTVPVPSAASPTSTTTTLLASPSANAPVADASVPAKALQALQIVRSTGQPPDGYVGGRVFQNRESRLPADGDYREFDVDPHNGNRNAERLIVEWKTKKAWYTGDHYQTFTPLP